MHPQIYSPGAGHVPPGDPLPGRAAIESAWTNMLSDVAYRGRAGARDLVLTGNRGVGKTVVMKQLARHAEAAGYARLAFQASSRSTLSLSLQQAISAHPHSTPEWKRPLTGSAARPWYRQPSPPRDGSRGCRRAPASPSSGGSCGSASSSPPRPSGPWPTSPACGPGCSSRSSRASSPLPWRTASGGLRPGSDAAAGTDGTRGGAAPVHAGRRPRVPVLPGGHGQASSSRS